MYLSRLLLNLRNRGVQYDLGNYYQLHRTLMQAFPETLPEQERVLFRVEPARQFVRVLVQSQTLPNWAHLEQRHGYLLPPADCPPQVLENPAIKDFTLNLRPQQRYTFRLRANPTVKHRRGEPDTRSGKNKGKRDPLYREEDQHRWITAKGVQHGFRLLKLAIFDEGNLYLWRKSSSGKTTKITIHGVRFEGVLEVTDAQALTQAVIQGIGPAKSFGCGLLSLARY